MAENRVELFGPRYLGEDEYYGPWYECSKCKNPDVLPNSKYCSECGEKLNWPKAKEINK